MTGIIKDLITLNILIISIAVLFFITNLKTALLGAVIVLFIYLCVTGKICYKKKFYFLGNFEQFNGQNCLIKKEKLLHSITSDIQKECFWETFAHDLKVPALAQLRGLELLQNNISEYLNEEQKELVEEIKKSCEYSLEMISSVLNAYRLENEQLQLIYEPFSIAELLLECFEEIEHTARDKGLLFIYEASCENTEIYADRTEIKKVIKSLLLSAVMYSMKGENIIVQTETSNNQLKFSVITKGIALQKQELSLSSDGFTVFKYTPVGLSIGLHLCKKIIDAHDGRICISTNGKDCNSFEFTIPQKKYENGCDNFSCEYKHL